MIVVYPSHHVRHRPPNEIFNGNRDPHAEVPERIEQIRLALESLNGVRLTLPRRFPLSWIERVHDRRYVSYLAEAGRNSGSTYTYPSVFPYLTGQHTNQVVGLRGQYSFDTYTPVNSSTYGAAHGSAMAALTAASLVRRGERVAYALCRPPGHHAERSRMGGYCYFNNAAIAAEYLSTRGKVAVLDIDVHHGNGTQNIFYERSDVLVVSIHGDPDQLYPYFSGRSEERGSGKGIGFTLNLPLSLGTKDTVYQTALVTALTRIKAFAPNHLVVSVGYDTHINDPIGKFKLSTQYFRRIGEQIASLGFSVVLIQEGGYNTATLGEVANTFTKSFLST